VRVRNERLLHDATRSFSRPGMTTPTTGFIRALRLLRLPVQHPCGLQLRYGNTGFRCSAHLLPKLLEPCLNPHTCMPVQ
jgi:hypothetical protein